MGKRQGIVNIRGKEYETVAKRLHEFRKLKPEWTIRSFVEDDDGKRIRVKAEVLNEEGRVIGDGFAEEVRGDGNVNKTSALENCQTSAVGRALFFALALDGGSVATAEEVMGALAQQDSGKSGESAPAATDGSKEADKKTLEATILGLCQASGVSKKVQDTALKSIADRCQADGLSHMSHNHLQYLAEKLVAFSEEERAEYLRGQA